MKTVLFALALSLTSSAFASSLEYTCVSEEAGLTLAITERAVITVKEDFETEVYESNMDLKQTSNGLLVGVSAEEFFVQILDNDKEVLPGVLMINDRDFVELKCVRD